MTLELLTRVVAPMDRAITATDTNAQPVNVLQLCADLSDCIDYDQDRVWLVPSKVVLMLEAHGLILPTKD